MVFTLPAAVRQPYLQATVEAGRLRLLALDLSAAPAALPDGPFVTITFTAHKPQAAQTVTSALRFDPQAPASLGSTTGQSLPVVTVDGVVQIAAAAGKLYLPLIAK